MIARALASVVIIAGIWLVGIPWFLIGAGVDPVVLRLGGWRVLGLIPLAAGMLVFGWVTWSFAAVGRGTPLVFDAPIVLVVGAAHKWVRNPMYLADVLIIGGLGIFVQSSAVLVYGATLWLSLHGLVVAVEEPRLRRRFGAAYDDYCRRVPRWLPRVDALAAPQ